MANPGPFAPDARPRLLLIDDEPLIGTVVRRLFAAEYDVVTTTSAHHGLELLRTEGPFALVLCDLMMPEMTGMEVYEELQQVAPDHARRMVFLTGGAFTGESRAFLDRIPNDRIEKPFDTRQFRALLQRLVPAAAQKGVRY